LKRLHEERLAKQRKERKKNNEKKARELLKLQLHMTAPEGLDNEDRALAGEEEIFDLGEGEREAERQGRSTGLGEALTEVDGLSEEEEEEAEEENDDDEVLDSDEERELKLGDLEGQLDGLYDEYKERMAERDAKWRVKQARAKDKNFDSWHGIREGSDSEDERVDKGFRDGGIKRVPRRGDADDEAAEESDEGGWDVVAATKARLGEEPDSSDEEEEESRPKKIARVDDGRPRTKNEALAEMRTKGLVTSLREKEERAQMSRQAQVWFDQSVFKGVGDLAALDGDDEEEEEEDDDDEDEEMSDEDEEMSDEEEEEVDEEGDVSMDGASDEDDFEIVPVAQDDGPSWDVDDEDQDELKKKIIQGEWIANDPPVLSMLDANPPDKGLLTAEAVTLATQLVNRQTTADKLVNDGFNRLSTFNKDGLPSWFLDDEAKFYKPNIPITKEAINALRERQRALDARPIKKVAEAKARKKFKAHQRLEKARKKADGVMEAEDLNDGEKARQVGKMLGRATGKEKKKEKKVVVARGVNRGVKGRPKGVKGRYKIVDSRMRKEVRALKRIKKASKKRS
jgi:AdoMet-dependent rRNA methyltransferase SPB1